MMWRQELLPKEPPPKPMTPTLLKQMASGVQGQILPDSSPFTVTGGNFKHMSFKLKINKVQD